MYGKAVPTAATQREGKGRLTQGQGHEEASSAEQRRHLGLFLREHYQLLCCRLHPVNLTFASRTADKEGPHLALFLRLWGCYTDPAKTTKWLEVGKDTSGIVAP